MTEFKKFELQQLNEHEYALIVHLDNCCVECADELGYKTEFRKDLICSARKVIRERFPHLRVTVIKLMIGGVIINGSTFVPIRTVSESLGALVSWNGTTQTVLINQQDKRISFVVGSTIATVNGQQQTTPTSFILNGSTMVPLRFVSETLGLFVDWNQTTSTVTLTSKQTESTVSVYTVAQGDTLWSIANKFNLTVEDLKKANNLLSEVLQVNQKLLIPNVIHTVNSGESLWLIASKYGVSMTAIKEVNKISSDIIYVGQKLLIPIGNSNGVSVTFVTHTVRSGDNIWNISQQYGIPYLELLQVNNLTEKSVLTIGQILKIPVYKIPVKQVVSSKHGELLDWWTEARYVFSTGKVATITDFQTERKFQVKHTMGGSHADSEPLTTLDAQIMKEIWGGSYSWTPRAIIVAVDGRRLAAAMHSFPHEDQVIKNNNYNGHFCIHFLNSQRHSDGLVQDSMQTQIKIAAGLR